MDVPPRDTRQRKHDLLARLAREREAWVSTSSPDAEPYLVPLWFHWDGTALWLSTRSTNPTGRNLRAVPRARVSLGDPWDVVLVDGTVETFTVRDVPTAVADAIAADWAWDPRAEGDAYGYFRVQPRSIQVWRGVPELAGRWVMRDGAWAD
ncbi:pyridoxamine 5'-phosphate oxidase family protein [Uniformispora flossi]|uniref:pyridoxamine 5'-phosphate oxidase family protein n=1 Tax=Uniformispora flossi TaxID=3390723 RepID=UPI003C2AE34B